MTGDGAGVARATHPLWRPFSVGPPEVRHGRVAHRQVEPGALQTVDAGWRDRYEEVARLIRSVLGADALAVQHVGSTAVPGLLAKPVIDIDLVVADPADEDRYLPGLEAAGFRLTFRDELGGSVHRQLALAAPNTNLHVWGPDAVEPARHRLFVAWLHAHPQDRTRYAASKVAASTSGGRYNDRKAAVVYDIYESALAADAAHGHDAHPRVG